MLIWPNVALLSEVLSWAVSTGRIKQEFSVVQRRRWLRTVEGLARLASRK
jgi:hypothetical protein